jgi:hypothetical protein
LAHYERITGFKETNFNALFDHVISRHGPPCPKCGKLLRTAIAFKCFECGCVLHEPNWAFLFRLSKDGVGIRGKRAIIAEAGKVEGRVEVGDKIEIREADRIVVRANVESIEPVPDRFAGSPDVALVLAPEWGREMPRTGQDVWLVGSPRFGSA